MKSAGDFVRTQRNYYEQADPAHFEWQTRSPYFADTEADLFAGLSIGASDRLLEIGCGEGGNLFHLRKRGSGPFFGVDFSAEKASFAHRATGAHTAVADAAHLPFPTGAFDVVVMRDILHHLPDRSAAVREAYRVLRPGGRLLLLEPNAGCPLIQLQAALIPAERGVRISRPARLESELGSAGFIVRRFEHAQPLPIARVVLHPKLHLAGLARFKPVRNALAGVDAAARRLIPPTAWLYLTFEAQKPMPESKEVKA